MATYDRTGKGGSTGHPANGRTPYLVENTIDISAINSSSGTADGDTNATGFSAATATARHVAASADTLDLLVLSAASSAGKVRVYAVMCDISGIDETDRNTDTQHDTAV